MKTLLLAMLCFSAWVSCAGAADPAAALDAMIDRRIALNVKYREANAQNAVGASQEKELVAVEKAIGQAWVDYLKYVRSLRDNKLKIHVLRIEFLDEIRSSHYEIENAGKGDKTKFQTELAGWKKEFAEVEKIAEQLNAAAAQP